MEPRKRKDWFDRVVMTTLAAIAAGALCTAQGDAVQANDTRVRSLRASNWKERKDAASALRTERKQVIEALLDVAKTRDDETLPYVASPRRLAVQLLGEYRAAEAAATLAKDIAVPDKMSLDENMDPVLHYPCARALIQIGSPALPEVFAQLGFERGDRELKLYACVIREIDGEEIGLYRLETKLKSNAVKATNFRKNLTRLIEIYKMGPAAIE